MASLSWLHDLPFWFVALPDDESARPPLAALREHATRQLSHPSGRPWVVGCWPEGTVTAGQAGTVKVAVLGQHRVTADRLAKTAGRVRVVADLDRLAASLAGSFHLV